MINVSKIKNKFCDFVSKSQKSQCNRLCEMRNVYLIDTHTGYFGTALVAAKNIEEANEFIAKYKQEDIGNEQNSLGFCNVDELDLLDNVYSNKKGIIFNAIMCGGYYV